MSDRDEATKHKNDGNQHFKKKNWDMALACYSKAIECDGSWEVPYSNRSQVYYMKKDYESAYKDGLGAIKANSDYVKGYHRAINALVRLNKWYVPFFLFFLLIVVHPCRHAYQDRCVQTFGKGIQSGFPIK